MLPCRVMWASFMHPFVSFSRSTEPNPEKSEQAKILVPNTTRCHFRNWGDYGLGSRDSGELLHGSQLPPFFLGAPAPPHHSGTAD